MKVTIDNTEYEIDDADTDTLEIVNILQLGDNSLRLIDHIRNCVSSVQKMKVDEIKTKLPQED